MTMKNLLLLSAAAFLTAIVLGYTFKHPEPKVLSAECTIGCFNAETRDLIQLDAAKQKSDKWLFVIQEFWGLNDYIKKEAETYYSELGNVNVLALDMYDGKVSNNRDTAASYMRAAKPERLENIIKAAFSYAGANAKFYTVGWCFGGGWSLQASILAAGNGQGCVMFYGKPENDLKKLMMLNGDVIGFFGNQDKNINPEVVANFEKNMQQAGKKLTVYRYDAGHGFANPSNPVYDKDAAEDSHKKAIAFLKERM